jgi:hypothetical protein
LWPPLGKPPPKNVLPEQKKECRRGRTNRKIEIIEMNKID